MVPAGILRQPKWGHLKDLHATIKLCEPALTAVDGSPQYVKLGPMQEVCCLFYFLHYVVCSNDFLVTQEKIPFLLEHIILVLYLDYISKDDTLLTISLIFLPDVEAIFCVQQAFLT